MIWKGERCKREGKDRNASSRKKQELEMEEGNGEMESSCIRDEREKKKKWKKIYKLGKRTGTHKKNPKK